MCHSVMISPGGVGQIVGAVLALERIGDAVLVAQEGMSDAMLAWEGEGDVMLA